MPYYILQKYFLRLASFHIITVSSRIFVPKWDNFHIICSLYEYFIRNFYNLSLTKYYKFINLHFWKICILIQEEIILLLNNNIFANNYIFHFHVQNKAYLHQIA